MKKLCYNATKRRSCQQKLRDFRLPLKYIYFIKLSRQPSFPQTIGSGMKSPTRRPRSLLFPAFALVLLATGVLWFLFNRGTPPPPPHSPAISEGVEAEQSTELSPGLTEPASVPLPGAVGDIGEQAVAAPTLPSKEQLPLAVEKINAFYHSLDQQQYIRAHRLATPSPIYLSGLIQKVVDNPPVVIRETDDLYTILKNSAHFFRILGKDDILLLRDILNQEKEQLEEVIANFYLLSGQPDALAKEFSLKIPENSLYEYACFFLNTMGGKLYLARRDSRTRMLVTYYSIHIIHEANREGINKYGLALQPAIDMLIAEMETGGNHLLYKEAYLDTLYDLKERYQ